MIDWGPSSWSHYSSTTPSQRWASCPDLRVPSTTLAAWRPPVLGRNPNSGVTGPMRESRDDHEAVAPPCPVSRATAAKSVWLRHRVTLEDYRPLAHAAALAKTADDATGGPMRHQDRNGNPWVHRDITEGESNWSLSERIISMGNRIFS